MNLTTLWRGGRPTRAPYLRDHGHDAAARIVLADPEIVLGYVTDSNRDERYVTMTVQRDGIQVEFRVNAADLAHRLERAEEWRRTGVDLEQIRADGV